MKKSGLAILAVLVLACGSSRMHEVVISEVHIQGNGSALELMEIGAMIRDKLADKGFRFSIDRGESIKFRSNRTEEDGESLWLTVDFLRNPDKSIKEQSISVRVGITQREFMAIADNYRINKWQMGDEVHSLRLP
jgi:hypothetical protein